MKIVIIKVSLHATRHLPPSTVVLSSDKEPLDGSVTADVNSAFEKRKGAVQGFKDTFNYLSTVFILSFLFPIVVFSCTGQF